MKLDELSGPLTLEVLKARCARICSILNNHLSPEQQLERVDEFCRECLYDDRFLIMLEVGFQTKNKAIQKEIDKFKTDEAVYTYLRFMYDSGLNIKNQIRARVERYTNVLDGPGVKSKKIANYLNI